MQDLISRKWLMECIDEGWIKFDSEKDTNLYIHLVRDIAPSARPYTDEEIQKIQDLEQTQFYKIHDLAYQEGIADAMQYIFCREGLPEKPGAYKVIDHNGCIAIYVFTGTDSSKEYWKRCVKAWMPKPYRENNDGTC